jgi:hypothetical protein
MAMDQAIYNNLPKRGSGMAPVEVFTGMKFENYEGLQWPMSGVVSCMSSILCYEMAKCCLSGILERAVLASMLLACCSNINI